MSDRQWLATADGDLGTAGNWSGGVAPVNGDRVFFNTGAVSVTAGFTDLAAVDLAGLIFTDDWTGNLGNSSSYCVFDVITELLMQGGTGHWLKATTITAGHISGGAASTDMLHLWTTTSMPFLGVYGGGGTVTVKAASVMTAALMNAQSAKLAIGASVTGFTTADLNAGETTFGTIAATMRLGNDARGIVNSGAGNIGTLLDIRGRAVCDYQGNGSIAQLTVGGPNGLFDFRKNNVAGDVTITNRTMEEGGLADMRSGQQNYIFTNPTSWRGGLIRFDLGDNRYG